MEPAPQQSQPAPADPRRETLLFGVATADHQCEAYEPRWEDIRDRWERQLRLVPRGRATDFWTRYPEDVELAREMGCTAFRFSVAWARIEPRPGVFDPAVLEHYRMLADEILKAGMEPVLTLHHYTWPLHIQDEGGGLIGETFPDHFAAYTAQVVRALGDRVRWWITFNEPDQLVYGYLKPWWQGEYRMPPGLPPGAGLDEQLRSVRSLMRNLFVANARARALIKAARPDAMVGANPFMLGLPGWLQRLMDWRTSRLGSQGAWDGALRRAARPRATGGRIDLVAAALTPTARRGRHVDFSRPYRVAALRLLVPSGSSITGPAEMRGATVVAVRGSTAELAAPDVLAGARVRPVGGYPAALDALRAGSGAAVLGDDAILDGLAAREPQRWRVTGPPLRRERHVVAVANGNRQLLQIVDDAIAGAPPRPLSAAEESGLQSVLRRGRLIAGVPDDLPGLGFRDPATGEWSGQEIDLVRRVAARIFGDEDRVTFEPIAVRRRIPALRPWSRGLDPLLGALDFVLCALNGNWWHLGMAGRLPEWLCPAECAHQQDYAGVDYYWGIPTLTPRGVHQLGDAIAGAYAGAPVWPGGMRRALRYVAGLFPGQPVLVVENGCVAVASGVSRAEYLRRHVRETLKARLQGVPLAGYLCWSITSNREWGLRFGPGSDFGLYHIELDTDRALTRTSTESASTYRTIVRSFREEEDRVSGEVAAPDRVGP
jgi:beta-glucosidase/6-phospho-beta-glucosidase/beta-galactosidase/ABC-type amino acid transport substrate-binding protein